MTQPVESAGQDKMANEKSPEPESSPIGQQG